MRNRAIVEKFKPLGAGAKTAAKASSSTDNRRTF
jgi:hypothetical protein